MCFAFKWQGEQITDLPKDYQCQLAHLRYNVVLRKLGHRGTVQRIMLVHYFDEIMPMGPSEQELSSPYMPSSDTHVPGGECKTLPISKTYIT